MSEEPRRPTLAHRAEYAAFTSAVRLAQLLGKDGPAAFGEMIGKLGYFPLRIRRNLVEGHLRMAFPDQSEAWIQQTTRGVYAHLGREAFATSRLGTMSRAELLALTTTVGFDAVDKALSRGKGVVLVSGHIGNHEIAAASLAVRGIPIDIVVQRQGNPLFDNALIAARKRMGVGVIDRFGPTRDLARSLRAGRMLGFAADQNAGRAGIFVPYFGKLASTHRGAALFAVRSGAPVILALALRDGAGYVIRAEPIEVNRDGPLDDVVYNLTAAFTARLEEVVRTAPEQYLWLHRRWKTRPPEEPKTPDKV